MKCKVAGAIKHASHFDYSIRSAAVQKKMPRFLHSCAADPVPARLQMIGAGAFDHDLGAFLRPCPLRVNCNIKQCLTYQLAIANGRLPEFPDAPFQYGGDVTTGGAGYL